MRCWLRSGAAATPDRLLPVRPAADVVVPYNAAYLHGRVYVSYSGGSSSALSVFRIDGKFARRLATGGPLAAPWGMTIAPEHWGAFGGAFLVGNVGDGKINAFNPRNGYFLCALEDAKGAPLVNVGLWGLTFGNGVLGNPRTLIFAAGIGKTPTDFGHFYEHGLIGAITPVEDKEGGPPTGS